MVKIHVEGGWIFNQLVGSWHLSDQWSWGPNEYLSFSSIIEYCYRFASWSTAAHCSGKYWDSNEHTSALSWLCKSFWRDKSSSSNIALCVCCCKSALCLISLRITHQHPNNHHNKQLRQIHKAVTDMDIRLTHQHHNNHKIQLRQKHKTVTYTDSPQRNF